MPTTQDAALAKMKAESLAQVVSTVNGKPVTRGQLDEAFEKVKPAGHWKNPIDARVELDIEEVAMVDEAVGFFTGSRPDFIEIAKKPNGKSLYRVVAPGYFQNIGP